MIEDVTLLAIVNNFIAGKFIKASSSIKIEKLCPKTGKVLWHVARSNEQDVIEAVAVAKKSQSLWAAMTPVKRGEILFKLCSLMELEREKIADIVAQETGKSHTGAVGETNAAIALGRFYAGEGQRLYSRTMASGVENRMNMTLREPCGVAALIVAANTPIANVAWKAFPALICGNAVVLKASEDTPMVAALFAELVYRAGVPAGVFNVIQGLGKEAGAPLIEKADVDVISFTGSTAVGRWIGETAGRRLIKCSLELGGKNPLIVCDDAKIDEAVYWALQSAFSNAGQRCAAGSRLIVLDAVYDEFVAKLTRAAQQFKVDPVINLRSLERMLNAIETAKRCGATLLCGGDRIADAERSNGYYLQPTLLDNVDPYSDLSNTELFGPIAAIYRVTNLDEAIKLANQSHYGLTAAVHTTNYENALRFVRSVQAGVVSVNGGTFGSEPHMPFGGVKDSGNGAREPGVEALDIYTELKDVYLNNVAGL